MEEYTITPAWRNHNVGTWSVVVKLLLTMTGGLILKSDLEYTGVTPQLHKKAAGGNKEEISG